MKNDKSKNKRAFFDRRSGQDRRTAYNLDYFVDGGIERRHSFGKERRDEDQDRRKEWIKISPWSSLHLEEKKPKETHNEEPPDIE
jgi:hypothetical protein